MKKLLIAVLLLGVWFNGAFAQSELEAAHAAYLQAFERYTRLVSGDPGQNLHGESLAAAQQKALAEYRASYARYKELREKSGSGQAADSRAAEVGSGPAGPLPTPTDGIEGIVSIDEAGVTALDVSPARGLRVTAPDGALDRERNFEAKGLSAEYLDEIFNKFPDKSVVPLGGFHLDSGMTADDRFHMPVGLSFNLRELGVPETLVDKVQLAHVDAAGRLRLLRSQLSDGQLSTHILHNGVFLYVLLRASFVAVVAYGHHEGVFDREIADYPDGWVKGLYTTLQWPPGARHRYVLHYPAAWPMANAQVVEMYRQRSRQLITRYGLHDAKDRYAAQAMMERLSQDQEYRQLQATMSEKQWVLDNYLPPAAGNVARALDLAVDYVDGRGFRSPGVLGVPWLPDVYVQPTSMGPNLYGEARNAWTTRAFMVLDGTKVPDLPPQQMNPEQQRQFTALKTTALHEYFHLVQSAYTFVDRVSQLWFAEATAVQFEAEAGRDYISRGWANDWDYTTRGYSTFAQALEQTSGPQDALQQHGYGAAYFLEFLRDRHYRANPHDFLVRLYDDYGRVRGGTIKSLVNVVPGGTAGLEGDFRVFARQIRINMVSLGHSAVLSANKPFHSWQFVKASPLSAPGLRVNIPQAVAAELGPEGKIVLRDSSGFMEETEVAWSLDRTNWQPLSAGKPTALSSSLIPAVRNHMLALQRIEPYIAPSPTPAAGKGQAATDVYLLLPPKQGPQMRQETDNLQLEIPASPLVSAPEPAGMGHYIQSVEIRIGNSGNGKSATVWADRGNKGFATRLPVSRLADTLGAGNEDEVEITARFRECAHKGQGIFGPWSPETVLVLKLRDAPKPKEAKRVWVLESVTMVDMHDGEKIVRETSGDQASSLAQTRTGKWIPPGSQTQQMVEFQYTASGSWNVPKVLTPGESVGVSFATSVQSNGPPMDSHVAALFPPWDIPPAEKKAPASPMAFAPRLFDATAKASGDANKSVTLYVPEGGAPGASVSFSFSLRVYPLGARTLTDSANLIGSRAYRYVLKE